MTKLKELDSDEYNKRFKSPRQLLKEEYLNRVDKPAYIDSDQMLFKNSFNHFNLGSQ